MPPVPIAISLAGLTTEEGAPWAGGARKAIGWAGGAGWRGIALDATAPETRPRELDNSARRDVAAGLRRNELAFAGLDLWIPPEHFVRAETIDRAIAAAVGACDLAAALHTLVGAGDRLVSLALPEGAADAVAALRAAAERAGVRIADYRWPPGAGTVDGPLGPGLDPAAILLAGADPVEAAAAHGGASAGARLSDLSPTGRIVPGARTGRLDAAPYLAALDVAGYRGHAVLDLRGVPDQPRAAEEAAERFASGNATDLL